MSLHIPDFKTTTQCLDTLDRVLAALTPGHSFQECLREVLAALTEYMHFDRPHIMVLDPESGVLRLSLSRSRADAPEVAYAPGTGITGRVFSSGESIIVSCMHNHPDFRNRLFGRSEDEMAHLAFLCVPVRGQSTASGREIVGTLSVDTPTAPSEELALRCRFLETVAALVGRQVAWLQEDMACSHFQTQDDQPVRGVEDIIAISKRMRHVLRQISQAGPSRATVLLRGESGVGKELMAQGLHAASPRRDKPLIRLNCAALPADLVEGELFGWKKGAFTGALYDRRGLFQQADGGTLFLDEIGDLSQNAQAKVLRALQEREIQPLGETRTLHVDVRLVCATNRPLETLVEQHLFREDLYYRINVFPIFIPPLRERPEDIVPLAEHYLRHFSSEYKRPVQCISTPAIDLMLQYPWPGNIRELQNVMERAVLVCDDAALRVHHLPASLQRAANLRDAQEGARPGIEETVARVEQEFIVDALKKTRGNIHQAARALGITYRIIYYKMKKYGIDYHRFLSGKVNSGANDAEERDASSSDGEN